MIFSDSFIMSYFHLYDVDIYLLIARVTLILYPPFNFARIFTKIARYSGKHMDFHQGRWVAGRGFQWSDLIHYKTGHRGEFHYFVPSAIHCFGYLIFDMLFFAFMIWYFDHVRFKQ
jgi:hypothetical protein